MSSIHVVAPYGGLIAFSRLVFGFRCRCSFTGLAFRHFDASIACSRAAIAGTFSDEATITVNIAGAPKIPSHIDASRLLYSAQPRHFRFRYRFSLALPLGFIAPVGTSSRPPRLDDDSAIILTSYTAGRWRFPAFSPPQRGQMELMTFKRISTRREFP